MEEEEVSIVIPLIGSVLGLIFGGYALKRAMSLFNIRLVERREIAAYEREVKEMELARKSCAIELKARYKKDFPIKSIK